MKYTTIFMMLILSVAAMASNDELYILGVVRNATTNNLTESYQNIYLNITNATTGALVYSQTQNDQYIDDGVYHTTFDSITNHWWFSPEVNFAIKIGNDHYPTTSVIPVPQAHYAYASNDSRYLGGIASSEYVTTTTYPNLDTDSTDDLDITIITALDLYNGSQVNSSIDNKMIVGYFSDISNFTGTLTNEKICRYNSGTGEIDCDYTDLTGGGGGTGLWDNYADDWHRLNQSRTTNEDVDIERLNASNITAQNAIFKGEAWFDDVLGYSNVRLGAYEGVARSGRIIFEYKSTENTIWQIDNGGDNLRFLNNSEVFGRINKSGFVTEYDFCIDSGNCLSDALNYDTRLNSTINQSIDLRVTVSLLQNLLDTVYQTVGNYATHLFLDTNYYNKTQVDASFTALPNVTMQNINDSVGNWSQFLETYPNIDTDSTDDGAGSMTNHTDINQSQIFAEQLIQIGQLYMNGTHTCWDYPTLAHCTYYNTTHLITT